MYNYFQLLVPQRFRALAFPSYCLFTTGPKSKAAGFALVKRITVFFPTKGPLSSLFVFKRVFVCACPSTYCTCKTEIALCLRGHGLTVRGGSVLLCAAASLLSHSCRSRGRVYILAVWGFRVRCKWHRSSHCFSFTAQFAWQLYSNGYSQDTSLVCFFSALGWLFKRRRLCVL